MIFYKCPHCGVSQQCPEHWAGKLTSCSSCHTELRVPLPPIQYKCPTCSAVLESPGEMGGREDVCPGCGTKSTVPMLPHQKAVQKVAQIADEAERQQQEAKTARIREEQRIVEEDRKSNQRRQGGERDTQKTIPASASAVPSYWALNIVAAVFDWIGFGAIIGGLLMAFAIIFKGDTPNSVEVAGAVAMGGLIYGTIMIAICNALRCLRDIAINSFHSRNSLAAIQANQ